MEVVMPGSVDKASVNVHTADDARDEGLGDVFGEVAVVCADVKGGCVGEEGVWEERETVSNAAGVVGKVVAVTRCHASRIDKLLAQSHVRHRLHHSPATRYRRPPPCKLPAILEGPPRRCSCRPQGLERVKTLIYKPKTTKTATPVTVVIVVRDQTETSSSGIGKALNQKELCLVSEDLLGEFSANSRERSPYSTAPAVSPLTLTADNFLRVTTVVDSTISTTIAPLGIHNNSSSSTVFASGREIHRYLKSLTTDSTQLDELGFSYLAAADVSSCYIFKPWSFGI